MSGQQDFPSDSNQQKIGRAGEAKAAAFFATPSLGLAWRAGETSTDWGIDGELELVGEVATGLLVKAQIKGTEDTEPLRRTGSQTVKVEPKTWNLWAAVHLPVVAVLVDINTGEIYWTFPERAFATDRKSVRFERNREATKEPKRFVTAIARAARSPASADLLDQLGHHLWTYKRLRQEHHWLDIWWSFSEADAGQLAAIYDHILRLRVLMGFETQPLPYSMWLARSQAISDRYKFDDYSGVVEAVGREMLVYLEPYYVEALVRAGEVAALGDVALAHPNLAELAWAGVLSEPFLHALLDPNEQDPPVGVSATYHRDFGPFASDRVQAALDARLKELDIRVIPLSKGDA